MGPEAGGLVLDGMPLRRAGGKAKAVAAAGWAAPELPGRSMAGSLTGQGKKLVVAALIRGADRLMAQGRWGSALSLPGRAQGLTGRQQVRLLRRLGQCNLMLGRRAVARRYLGRALKLDPNNPALKRAHAATR